MYRPHRSWLLPTLLLIPAFGCSREGKQHGENLVRPADEQKAVFPRLRRVAPPPAGTADLYALWMQADGKSGWAVGDGPTFLHLTGTSWHPDTASPSAHGGWRDVVLSRNGSVGWMVGVNGQNARYAGGHTWVIMPSLDSTATLSALWLDQSGHTGLTVGAAGRAFRLAGGQWDPFTLPHSSGADLTSVAANGNEVWVRDTLAVVNVYSWRGLEWLGSLEDVDGSKVWSDSQRLWVAGVTYPMVNGQRDTPDIRNRYTIRWKTGETIDSVNRIPVLPAAAGLSASRRCGIVAGARSDEEDNAPRLVYLAPGGEPYVMHEQPGTAIRAIWVSEGCDAGWLVGSRGFLAGIEFSGLLVRELTWKTGKIERLTGEYHLVLQAHADHATLDSMKIVAQRSTLVFLPAHEYRLLEPRGDTLAFLFESAARERLTPLSGQSLRLQLFLSYGISDPRYPVSYVKEETFTFTSGDAPPNIWSKVLTYLMGIVVALVVSPVLYAIVSLIVITTAVFLAWPRRLICKPRPLYVEKDRGKRLFLTARELIENVRRLRLALFRSYRKNALQAFSPAPNNAPSVRIPDTCDWLGRRPFHGDAAALHAMIKQVGRKEGALWLDDTGSGDGERFLRSFMFSALRAGDTAFLVTVDDSESTDVKLGREMEEFGDIPHESTWLIEQGGFVILLNVHPSLAGTDALRSFILDRRMQNVVIACSAAPCPINNLCEGKVDSIWDV